MSLTHLNVKCPLERKVCGLNFLVKILFFFDSWFACQYTRFCIRLYFFNKACFILFLFSCLLNYLNRIADSFFVLTFARCDISTNLCFHCESVDTINHLSCVLVCLPHRAYMTFYLCVGRGKILKCIQLFRILCVSQSIQHVSALSDHPVTTLCHHWGIL